MDINIRSHISLHRQTKDMTFGCRAALNKKIQERISSGVVTKLHFVSHHPEPSVVILFLNHWCAQTHTHRSRSIFHLV